MSDMKNIFDQYIEGDMKTYENIRKVFIGQGDNFTTGCVLDYLYLKENYKMIALYIYIYIYIYIYKQQAFYLNPKVIQQISFTANLDQTGHRLIFFHLWRNKNTVLTFSQGNV